MKKDKCTFIKKPFYATSFRSENTEWIVGAPTVEALCFVLDRICTYHTGYDKKDFKNIILRPVKK